MKINLGCGRRPFDGYVNVDIVPYPGVDKVADIGKAERLPFDDNTADEIYAGHLFEHMDNPIKLLLECWRILKAAGSLALVLPNIAADPGRFADRDYGIVTGLGFTLEEMPSRNAHDIHYTFWTPDSLIAFVTKFGFAYAGIINLDNDQRVTKPYQWQFGREFIKKAEFPLLDWYKAYLRQRVMLEKNGEHG